MPPEDNRTPSHRKPLAVDGPPGPVTVNIHQPPAPPAFISQANSESTCGLPGPKFLAELHRSGLPSTASGHLRLVAFDAFVAYLEGRSAVRKRPGPPPTVNDDAAVFAAAGLRVVGGGK